MRIMGCDLHARQQTIAMLDTVAAVLMQKCGMSNPTAHGVAVLVLLSLSKLNTLDEADFVRDVEKSSSH
jgi:hypothetical protein